MHVQHRCADEAEERAGACDVAELQIFSVPTDAVARIAGLANENECMGGGLCEGLGPFGALPGQLRVWRERSGRAPNGNSLISCASAQASKPPST